MVRLSDLPEHDRNHLLMKQLPPLGPPQWVTASKPLSEMRFALITTAGLHYRGDENYVGADASYRAIDAQEDTADLVMSHVSVNFDRSGFQDDVNVVFPLDRFRELAEEGVIGSVADVHYSFMGGGLMPDAYETSVRSLAPLLKRDHVDAVFITPVCPNCTRTASAIGYYLESEGIMSTGIALVRENAEALKPPRLLWVSFPLGYPLGKPGDTRFQRRVIEAGLDLLTRPSGPVLEDFPEDVPAAQTKVVEACPVNFAQPTSDPGTWKEQLRSERLLLQPWYDFSKRRRGRTTVGLSSASISEILDMVGGWLDDRDQPLPDFLGFKQGVEDAKAWYSEAISAQPGDYAPGEVQAHLYAQTRLGAALKEYFHLFIDDRQFALYARAIAPRWVVEANTGSEAIDKHGNVIEQPAAKAMREAREAKEAQTTPREPGE
ncbi:MAG: glycine/sarcosine/betaine reductase selenoprotein B family protein [Pseudomonadota bacterium]